MLISQSLNQKLQISQADQIKITLQTSQALINLHLMILQMIIHLPILMMKKIGMMTAMIMKTKMNMMMKMMFLMKMMTKRKIMRMIMKTMTTTT